MKSKIREILVQAVSKSGYNIPIGFSVEEPPRSEMGDFASNIALLIAKQAKEKPQHVAQKISFNICDETIKEIEIAGPGFINIFLNSAQIYEKFAEILDKKNAYGSSDLGKGKTVNVEYISANPTGPVHIGNARGGPIGQATANLLSFIGFKVIRSFYVNDIGGQIEKLAESFYYWYEKNNGQDIAFPEGGYPGDYVREITEKVMKKYKVQLAAINEKDDFIAFFKDKGVKAMVERIESEVAMLGIKYDDWIYQSDLENNGLTEEILKTLGARGSIDEREGATWFKNPDDPDFQDNEAVLRKSDGNKTLTYFADDIACHKYKIDQGADRMIDYLGPGHHGHIVRMKAAMQAIGVDPNRLEIIMYQNVRVKNGEEIIKMSKRAGNFVMLADVINFGIGADVFKYFILAQNNNTPMDFDMKLASDKSEKNPVFYIQYAYARICSILKKSEAEMSGEINLKLLNHEKELALIKELIKFPDLVAETSLDLQLQRIPHYVHKIAGMFHEFYNDCRVLGEEKELEAARLALVAATKIVLKNALKICDVSAPEKM